MEYLSTGFLLYRRNRRSWREFLTDLPRRFEPRKRLIRQKAHSANASSRWISAANSSFGVIRLTTRYPFGGEVVEMSGLNQTSVRSSSAIASSSSEPRRRNAQDRVPTAFDLQTAAAAIVSPIGDRVSCQVRAHALQQLRLNARPLFEHCRNR